MLPTLIVHPEGPRYETPLVFLPGLWTPPAAMRRLASFLGHRGWSGMIVDLTSAGSLAARAAAAAEVAASLPAPPVLIGHDAGGLVALECARRHPVAGVVWLAPLRPASRRFTQLVGPWRVAWAIMRGERVPRPSGEGGRVIFGPDVSANLCGAEQAAAVRDVVRGRVATDEPPPRLALVQGERDPLADEVEVTGAARLTVAGAERWLLGGPRWQAVVGVVHRWLVQQLGAENLEFYEEAMAERDEG